MPIPTVETIQQLEKKLEALRAGNSDRVLQELEDSLSRLYALTTVYFTKNDQTGKYTPFGENDRERLLKQYAETAKACQNALKIDRDDPVLKEINLALSNGISALAIAGIGPTSTLPRIADYAREQTVDVSGMELGKAGANMSSRIPMTIRDENGEEVRGFFTEETKVDPLAMIRKTFEETADRYGEEAAGLRDLYPLIEAEMLKRINERVDEDPYGEEERAEPGDPRIAEELWKALSGENPKNANHPTTAERLYLLAKELGAKVPDSINGIVNQKAPYSPFERALIDIGGSWQKIKFQYDFFVGDLGLKQGDNIDLRNAAMSTVAGLLGVPNLIVKSVPMTIRRDGKVIRGTFLPNAEGVDKSNVNVDDRRIGTQIESYQNTDAFKDLADLQVLDYICGNVDRHMANVFYQFDDDGKFSGVQGIDNDGSFGLTVPGKDKGFNRLTARSRMGFISQSMAERVKNLTPELLRTALACYGMDEGVLEAACARLENLKDTIREGEEFYRNHPGTKLSDITPGYTRIIPDAEFRNIDFTDRSLFDQLRERDDNRSPSKVTYGYFLMAEFVTMTPEERAEKQKAYKPFEQPTARVYRLSDEAGMTDQANAYAEQLKELEQRDAWYIPSSDNFSTMKVSLMNLRNLTEEYRGRALDAAGFRRLEEELRTLDARAKTYVEEKSEEKGRSAYAEKRLNFAKELRKFVADRQKELAEQIKGEVDTRTDRAREARILMDELAERMKQEPFTPEFAGTVIRTANSASRLLPARDQLNEKCEEAVSQAIRYLNSTPDGIARSKLTRQDLQDASHTVNKGMLSREAPKSKAAAAAGKTKQNPPLVK